MAFRATEHEISKLFVDGIYRIPRNQREYVWSVDNWKDIFSDIIYAMDNQFSHFIGSIVLIEGEKNQGLQEYIVIDGQQRIMTVSIFLTVIVYKFYINDLINHFKGSEKYLVTTDNQNNRINVFESDFHQSYNDIVYNIGELKDKSEFATYLKNHTDDYKRDRNIIEAFLFFDKEIDSYIQSHNADEVAVILEKLRDTLLKISYVKIQASSEEDSYTIFEILNARGRPLADYDLLKNFIMRYIQPQSRRDKTREDWDKLSDRLGRGMSSFIKHYVNHRYPFDENNRKEPYKIIKKNVPVSDVANLFNDLKKKSHYYMKIYFPQELDSDGNRVCTSIEYKVFSFFKSKRQEQMRPILLSLMHQKDLGKISESKYNQILYFLKNFFCLYTLIGKEKSNTISSIIFKYAYKIENEDDTKNIENFVISLKNRMPNEQWFYNAFQNLGWSNHSKFFSDEKEKEKVQFALQFYENSLPSPCTDDFTIEHILPDSQGEENAKLGNLLPLEKELNEKCKDKELKEKIPYYKQSHFATVKKFVDRYENDYANFSSDDRLTHLAKAFYKVFIAEL